MPKFQKGDTISFISGWDATIIHGVVSRVVPRADVHELDARGTNDLFFYEIEADDGTLVTLPEGSVNQSL